MGSATPREDETEPIGGAEINPLGFKPFRGLASVV
jgi:hypothetical protein